MAKGCQDRARMEGVCCAMGQMWSLRWALTLHAARIPGMSLSGTVGWGIKTWSVLLTDQNEKLGGGKEEWRLILSRAALRVCTPKLQL